MVAAMKTFSKYLLALSLVVTGSLHILRPDFYLKIMPPYMPWPLELVYLSGAIGLLLGLFLLVPRCSRWAAWGIIALLIAVFPANLYLYQHQEIMPGPPLLHLLRLPLQAVFILWASWHTKGDGHHSGKSPNRSGLHSPSSPG